MGTVTRITRRHLRTSYRAGAKLTDQPGGNSGDQAPVRDPLVARINNRGELRRHPQGIVLNTGTWCQENQYIERLLALTAGYSNNVAYDYWPFTGTGYNSNSFTRGLLIAAGLSAPNLDPNVFLDWGHPLPRTYFYK